MTSELANAQHVQLRLVNLSMPNLAASFITTTMYLVYSSRRQHLLAVCRMDLQ